MCLVLLSLTSLGIRYQSIWVECECHKNHHRIVSEKKRVSVCVIERVSELKSRREREEVSDRMKVCE